MPDVSRDRLEAKLGLLRQALAQHQANFQATNGAIQVIEELLRADEEETKPHGDHTPHVSP